MSNFLVNVRLNNLQTEIDLLKAVDGLTNPLSGPLNADSNNITSVGSLGCDSLDAATIIATGSIECDNLVLPNQDAGGLTLSIQSSIVDTKSMLTVCTNGGANSGNIYDSYYNPPPTASLANILATSSNAGGGAITNLTNLTTTGSVSTPYLNLPLTTANPNLLSDFLILKANNNPDFGPSAVSFAYKAGTNPDPTGLTFSCFNDDTVNPVLATVLVRPLRSDASRAEFPYYKIPGDSHYFYPIYSFAVSPTVSFTNISMTIPSIYFETASGLNTNLATARDWYLMPALSNSLSGWVNDIDFEFSHHYKFTWPALTPNYYFQASNLIITTQYTTPQTANCVWLSLYYDSGDDTPAPFPTIFAWNLIQTAGNSQFELSNNRITRYATVTYGGGGVTP